jgi:FkbM family methyltransferase
MMNDRVRVWILKHLPIVADAYRLLVAIKDACLPIKDSYSQHGEDKEIEKLLAGFLSRKDFLYVDVGANHPTTFSNTYRLYRMGWKGIVIDPDLKLLTLHKAIRRNDVQVNIGCGRKSSLLPFYFDTVPVMSSFKKEAVSRIQYVRYIPIVPLDSILESFEQKVAFLSIDTEGFDLEVLTGATETLKRTYLLCVESNTEDRKSEINNLLSPNFDCVGTFGCNQLFLNRHFHV